MEQHVTTGSDSVRERGKEKEERNVTNVIRHILWLFGI